MKTKILLLAVLLLAGCGGGEQTVTREGSPSANVRGKLKALEAKPIDLVTSCRFKNETGYSGTMTAEIRDGVVKRLSTSVKIPDQGSCNFEWDGFVQRQRLPSIELYNSRDGCTAKIWQQGRQVTVSYSNCAQRCTSSNAFKYVWPVLVDRSSGRCD